jgi:glycerophosphoryl diester phosphodiesterase
MKFQKMMIVRSLVQILVVSLIILVGYLYATAEKNDLASAVPQAAQKLLVIGHRGAAGLAPENTLSAFQKACETGVGAVELDVLSTSDGKIAVHHNYTLKPETTRTPDGQWLHRPGPAIKDLSLVQLKTYDVGRLKPNTRYSSRYPEQQPVDGERIPTLGEVVSLVSRNCNETTQLWVEIKTNPEKPNLTPPPENITDAVIKLVREQNYSGRLRILAFDWRVLVHVQKNVPEIPAVYLTHDGARFNTIKPGQPGASPWMAGLDIDDFSGSIPRAVKAAGGKYWAPSYKQITYALLEEAHRLGLKVYVWTVDSRSEMDRMIEMGVDGIITNRPDILKLVVGSP